MSKEIYYGQFLDALLAATASIGDKYFRLPIAGGSPIYRERVYCYELYHQLRKILGNDYPYMLSGEIDKNSHPYIVSRCGAIKPDFLVHKPGGMGMEANLAIVEVKSIERAIIGSEDKGLLKDFKNINCMVDMPNGYYKGVILVYGNTNLNHFNIIKDEFRRRCSSNADKFDLLFHREVEARAERVNQG